MALFSGNKRPTKTIQLNDSDGTDKFTITNSRGFVVAEIDSQGNQKIKGSFQKR